MTFFVALLMLAALASDTSSRRGIDDPGRLRLVRAVTGGDDFLFPAALSPDGRLLAAGRRDGGIAILDSARLVEIRRLAAHEGYVHSVSFSRDGRFLASAGADRIVRIWDLAGAPVPRALLGHAAAVLSVAFSAHADVLVSGGGDEARVWRLPGQEPPLRLPHGATVFSVAVTRDRVATAGSDGVVKIWNLATGQPLQKLKACEGPLTAVAFTPGGGRIAAVGLDGKLRVWLAESGRLLHVIDAHAGIAAAVAFSSDGRFAASAGADGVKFWDGAGRLRGTLAAGAPAYGVTFGAGGSEAVTTFGDNRLRVWSARPGKAPGEGPIERAPGFLGVSHTDGSGALITSIVAGSQAERVGLMADDVIVAVDTSPMASSSDFFNFMRQTFEGDEITIRIRRDNEERYVRAKLGRRP